MHLSSYRNGKNNAELCWRGRGRLCFPGVSLTWTTLWWLFGLKYSSKLIMRNVSSLQFGDNDEQQIFPGWAAAHVLINVARRNRYYANKQLKKDYVDPSLYICSRCHLNGWRRKGPKMTEEVCSRLRSRDAAGVGSDGSAGLRDQAHQLVRDPRRTCCTLPSVFTRPFLRGAGRRKAFQKQSSSLVTLLSNVRLPPGSQHVTPPPSVCPSACYSVIVELLKCLKHLMCVVILLH